MIRAAKFSSARRRSARAWVEVGAGGLLVLRSSASIENSLLRAAARGLTASIWQQELALRDPVAFLHREHA